MTESLVNKANRELLEAQKIQTYILSAKEAIDTAVEQGLWVAMSIDMWALSQRIYEQKDQFLYKQRYEIIQVLKTLSDKKLTVGIFDIGKVPNPMYYMFRFLKPLTGEMEKHGWDDEGKLYYEKMAPIPTMILAFVFPGMLRMIGKQLGEIIPA